MNRFKGLDMVDRVPDELWMEVCNVVQEVMAKTIPNKKKCEKAKWLLEMPLQIAVKAYGAKNGGKEGEEKRLRRQQNLVQAVNAKSQV